MWEEAGQRTLLLPPQSALAEGRGLFLPTEAIGQFENEGCVGAQRIGSALTAEADLRKDRAAQRNWSHSGMFQESSCRDTIRESGAFMRRRNFLALIGGGAVAWPLAARAQQAPKAARLGYLAPASNPDLQQALLGGLRDLGYVEGQNLAIEYRFMLGQAKSYDELAAEIAGLAPDAIVVVGTPPALAAKRQTTTIPIIMAPAADPLRSGLVASLSRPGGNVTGVSLYGSELARKRMEVFKEAVVGIQRIAVLGNAENPLHHFLWDDLQPVGPALGLQFRLFVVSGLDKLPAVFSAMKPDGFDAMSLLSDAQFFSARRQISSLAAMHRLPAMYESRESVADGGLISYGASIPDLTRRATAFVLKVINGAKPADLPIEQPTKFELAINLRTAKALGLTVPDTLLARADEVIE
jgi:putative ABC transport system substrate-binding protein